MNHIVRLQSDLNAARESLSAQAATIHDFRVHLSREKFSGTEPDGSRKDWIAVSDVFAWLARILDAGREP